MGGQLRGTVWVTSGRPLETEKTVDLSPPHAPDIFITTRAFHRLKLLLRLCPAEIAGLGHVTPLPTGFLIKDLFVLPQRVTDSDAELNPEALSEFLAQFVASGGDPSSLQLWWHSHVDGEVYWSETDLETIERFPGDRVISIVGNQSGELLCRLDLFTPRRERLDRLPLVPVDEAGQEAALDLETLRREVGEEIKMKVKRRIPMEPLIDHEAVVGLISEEGYEVEVEPSDGSPPAG
ncbi:MAG: hypothetical protein ACREJ6_02205 [Candidatus Methylomirabilis sp.]